MKDSQDDPVKEKPDVPPDPVDAPEEAPEVTKEGEENYSSKKRKKKEGITR